jgi:RNA polymerase sigma-70 factor (sigma-E family)
VVCNTVVVVTGTGRRIVADSADFVGFVASRYRALVGSAFLLVGDRGQAEDLVQDALFRTFLAWDRLRAVEAAEAYTRTTMVRLAGRWWRRRWRGEVPADTDETACAAWGVPVGVDVALDVRAALAVLPWQQRAALILRFFDDLSEVDTAAVLGCSVGTVKSRTSRGLASLRAAGILAYVMDGEVRDG